MRSIQPPPPRFHGTQTAYVPANLASADYVYVRKDSHRHPLQRPHDGPYRVLNKSDKYFTLDVKGRTETVSIDRLSSCHTVGYSQRQQPCSLPDGSTLINLQASCNVFAYPVDRQSHYDNTLWQNSTAPCEIPLTTHS